MPSLTILDKRILNRLQNDIPFAKHPWKIIAKELGIQEAHLLKRIEFLKKKGVIRRIAVTFNPKKIGFSSTLIAAKVAPKNLDKTAKRINLYPEVTHNYKRNHEYNLWFTLVAKNKERISKIIKEIKKNENIISILNLPATKTFKINVNFNNMK